VASNEAEVVWWKFGRECGVKLWSARWEKLLGGKCVGSVPRSVLGFIHSWGKLVAFWFVFVEVCFGGDWVGPDAKQGTKHRKSPKDWLGGNRLCAAESHRQSMPSSGKMAQNREQENQ